MADEDRSDPRLANAAAAVQQLLDEARKQQDSPQLAAISGLLQSLRDQTGPANPEELRAGLEEARAEARGLLEQVRGLSDDELLALGRQIPPRANPQELAGFGAALAEAWRRQDGAAVERLLREARRRFGDPAADADAAATQARI